MEKRAIGPLAAGGCFIEYWSRVSRYSRALGHKEGRLLYVDHSRPADATNAKLCFHHNAPARNCSWRELSITHAARFILLWHAKGLVAKIFYDHVVKWRCSLCKIKLRK